jgi:hypothetical protein
MPTADSCYRRAPLMPLFRKIAATRSGAILFVSYGVLLRDLPQHTTLDDAVGGLTLSVRNMLLPKKLARKWAFLGHQILRSPAATPGTRQRSGFVRTSNRAEARYEPVGLSGFEVCSGQAVSRA